LNNNHAQINGHLKYYTDKFIKAHAYKHTDDTQYNPPK
jgi:hypothetical protein